MKNFSDKCPRIALARVGLSDWDTYIAGWWEAQEDAPACFENKERYLNYLKSEGFSDGARMAASVVWDLYELEVGHGDG